MSDPVPDSESIASTANHPDMPIVPLRAADPMNHFPHHGHPDQQQSADQQPLSQSLSSIDPAGPSLLKYASALREQPDSTVIEFMNQPYPANTMSPDAASYSATMAETPSVSANELYRRSDHRSYEKRGSATLRPHSTPATLVWLEENYETADGVCIPRSALYMHYVDFCSRNCIQPVNAASFGKIIRQQFSQLTTRRLGTRGQSRYHYYGIAVRESSIYFQLQYSRKSGSRCVSPHFCHPLHPVSPQSSLPNKSLLILFIW